MISENQSLNMKNLIDEMQKQRSNEVGNISSYKGILK
jgi:hypothetical protein